MGAGTPAEAEVRRAVRAALAVQPEGALVLAAVSGGADSLALAYGLAREGRAAGVRAGAVVVDHGLQPGSGQVAQTAAGQCRTLGLDPVEVRSVTVTKGGDGLEAAAREARYGAIDETAAQLGASLVLLGHTRDDQAEQVLLGLARGSGARSLSGMPAERTASTCRTVRPLLDLPRETTLLCCAAAGLDVWDDPMNSDLRLTRVRTRRALADLDAALGPGVAEALARTADLLRDDADLLDGLADQALHGLSGLVLPGRVEVDVAGLLRLERAVRSRVWRRLLVLAGAPAGQLAAGHVRSCDRLLTDWRGQGPLHLPGPVRVRRSDGRVLISGATPV